jgi:hypothetical protein
MLHCIKSTLGEPDVPDAGVRSRLKAVKQPLKQIPSLVPSARVPIPNSSIMTFP